MLTIDWKERLAKDTQDYLKNKLPNQDYDFDIIFNAYPERVNGKIPSEVIAYVSGIIISKLGKDHEKYLPFYRYIWDKKGDHGRGAFIVIMARLMPKKPAVYLPLLEHAMQRSNPTELASILERVMLPLLRKAPQTYLPTVYGWDRSPREDIRKANVNLMIKLMKKEPDTIGPIITHYTNQWLQPLGDAQAHHVTLLKALYKIDAARYLEVWAHHGHQRDPQTVEILCAALMDYDPGIEAFVETWTHSGNARVKKAATTAMRVLKKKKG